MKAPFAAGMSPLCLTEYFPFRWCENCAKDRQRAETQFATVHGTDLHRQNDSGSSWFRLRRAQRNSTLDLTLNNQTTWKPWPLLFFPNRVDLGLELEGHPRPAVDLSGHTEWCTCDECEWEREVDGRAA